MPLAYVFWHWPAPGVDAAAYERDLLAFHAALALPGAHTARLDRAPFDGPPARPYEDWYPVGDWAAIGELNDRAVSGPRRGPHDTAAAGARGGTAGVYRLIAGEAGTPRAAAWLDKPRGAEYTEFVDGLTAAAPGAAIWQRQLVLGPAPEFAVLTGAPVELPGRAVAPGREPLG